MNSILVGSFTFNFEVIHIAHWIHVHNTNKFNAFIYSSHLLWAIVNLTNIIGSHTALVKIVVNHKIQDVARHDWPYWCLHVVAHTVGKVYSGF